MEIFELTLCAVAVLALVLGRGAVSKPKPSPHPTIHDPRSTIPSEGGN